MIEGHIAQGRYPGAQIAIARRGKLALVKTFGDAAIEPSRQPAADDTLWLLYSNTKVITACAVWLLVERGLLRFTDTIAQHVPGFEANGKGSITLIQLLTHQGGFPNADVPREAWDLEKVPDHLRLSFRVRGDDGAVLATGKDIEMREGGGIAGIVTGPRSISRNPNAR